MGTTRAALARLAWRVLRPILFRLPAELVHGWTMGLFSFLVRVPGLGWLTRALFRVPDPRLRLRVRRFGLEFPNPVGLAAGLDKDAQWYDTLPALGFGFIEVGTLTAEEQHGNPKQRVFRLKTDRALLNRMGSPNKGASSAAARLAHRPPRTILGINIGKTAKTPIELASRDYLTSFELLYPFASYFALNVSSPNTPGLRKLQAKGSLQELLRALMDRNADLARSRMERPKPLLVKIAPDLDEHQLEEVVDLCVELRLDGIIVANTTTSREGLTTGEVKLKALGAGGISGRPLTQRARALVAAVYRRTRGTLPIIGVGGVMTEEDAWQMIRAGASLVQVHTGLIYSGPGFVADINRHLLQRLAERGTQSIEDVIGEASEDSPAPKNDRAVVGRPVTGPA
jgi:dihydroorotate dehydrogenase